jgi:hypothetical protein
MQKKFMRLPIIFSEVKNSNFDNSMIPVDIKVMHDGLNLNNSTFFEEAIADASQSLKNKPILGYVQKVDGANSKDFKGHEVEISFDEGKTKLTYLERPLGVIPETNQYSIMEEDGKKFVFCRGYLWKEYLNDAYEVLQESPNKSVSMEIAVDDYDINEDGSMNIKKYRYLGVTVLGDNTAPAMSGAKLTVVGELPNKFSTDFYEKIEELNSKILAFSQEDKTVETEEVETEEFVETTEDNTEEVKTEDEFENGDDTDNTEEIVDKDESGEEEFKAEESQEIEYQTLEMAYDILKENFEELEVKFNEVVAERDLIQSKVTEYEKADKDLQLETLYAEFSELDEDELNSVKSKASDMTVEEVETVLFAMLGRKQKQFSLNKKPNVVRVSSDEKDTDEPYGNLFAIYNKTKIKM